MFKKVKKLLDPLIIICQQFSFQQTRTNGLNDSILKRQKSRLSFDARDYDISENEFTTIRNGETPLIYSRTVEGGNTNDKDAPFIYQSV